MNQIQTIGALDAQTLIANVPQGDNLIGAVNRFVQFVSDLDSNGQPTVEGKEYVHGFQSIINPHLYSVTDPFDGSEGHVAAFGPEQELTVFVEGSHWVFYHEEREVLAYFL